MKRLFIILSIILLINSYYANSQIEYSVDKWMEYIEEMASETEDEERIEALYTDLSYLIEHPFELNTVTEGQLKRLPFLSDLQIRELLEYRSRYGKMLTLYELKNVEAFDLETISLLVPFIYISEIIVDKRPITVKNLLKRGSNNLQIRYDRCFQQKKGYCSYPDSVLQQYPNRKYLGEPFYHSVRYSYEFDERIQFGLVAEKDVGEPFWNEYHKGYDYYSVHLFLKEMNKWLKSLAIGDYKISFGQGLVISNDFSPGRNALVSQTERRTNGFRRHFSINENDFFRGAAATVNWKNLDINFFYSYRKLDGGVDSTIVTSFKTDGLHRLVRDREKMHKVSMQTYGGNVRYATPGLCIGLTALSYSFGNYSIQPDPKPYNLFYFRGNRNLNISVDYLLKNKLIKFYGETALSRNGAVASLNALQLTPASYFSLLLLYRYYDKRYQAFFGNAFSQNSADTSIPMKLFTHSGSNGRVTGVLSLWSQSTTPPTISPASSSSTSCSALLSERRQPVASSSFSYLAEASVLIPSAFAVLLTETPLNIADSKTMVVVSSIIPEYSPPITPATATGLFSSAITSISGFKALSTPSRVVIFSPSSAFLTITLWPSR